MVMAKKRTPAEFQAELEADTQKWIRWLDHLVKHPHKPYHGWPHED